MEAGRRGKVNDPAVEEFTRIFELNCRSRGLPFHQVMVAYLYRRHYRPLSRAMRSCHPRDLLEQIIALCRYRGIAPQVTRELIDAACASYFVDGCETMAVDSKRSSRDRARQAATHLEIH